MYSGFVCSDRASAIAVGLAVRILTAVGVQKSLRTAASVSLVKELRQEASSKTSGQFNGT